MNSTTKPANKQNLRLNAAKTSISFPRRVISTPWPKGATEGDDPVRHTPSVTSFIKDFDARPDASFVRIDVVSWLFDCSTATIWRWVKESRIPAPKKLGSRISAWNVGELRASLAQFQSLNGKGGMK